MTVTSLEKASQLSRVCDATPFFRRRREQTLIGKGFSYSSAPLGGTNTRPKRFLHQRLVISAMENRACPSTLRGGRPNERSSRRT